MQLAYQICAQGRADLALAPDEATGFTMTLLRLLAFEPGGARGRRRAAGPSAAPPSPSAIAPSAAQPAARPVAAAQRARRRLRAATPMPSCARRRAGRRRADGRATAGACSALPADPAAWPAFVAGLKLHRHGGAARRADRARSRSTGNALTLALPAAHKHLADKAYADKLKAALEQRDRPQACCSRSRSARAADGVARRAGEARARARHKASGEAAFRDEPFVRDVLARFDAQGQARFDQAAVRDACADRH